MGFIGTEFKVGKADAVLIDAIETVQSHDLVQVVKGIKGAGQVPDYQAGAASFKVGDFTGTTSGDVTIKNVDVTNVYVTAEEKYTAAQLAGSILKVAMKQGVNPDDVPNLDIVMALKGSDIAKQYDKAIWLGDSDGTGSTLSDAVDGLVKKLKASADTKLSEVAPAALVDATAIASVKTFVTTLFSEIPRLEEEDVAIYLSPLNFGVWFGATYGTNGVINANTLNAGVLPTSIAHPSFGNVTIYSNKGLAGSNEMIGAVKENLIEVTDGDGETDFIKMHYSEDVEAYLLHVGIRLGTAVARYNEVLIQKVTEV